MPSGLEPYGIISGLDATTVSRLQSGFDEIRTVSGWENFRIPHDAWMWVTRVDRNKAAPFLHDAFFVRRDSSHMYGASQESMYAFSYLFAIMAAWIARKVWYGYFNPGTYLSDVLTTQWGIPSFAIDTSYSDSIRFTATIHNPWMIEEWETTFNSQATSVRLKTEITIGTTTEPDPLRNYIYIQRTTGHRFISDDVIDDWSPISAVLDSIIYMSAYGQLSRGYPAIEEGVEGYLPSDPPPWSPEEYTPTEAARTELLRLFGRIEQLLKITDDAERTQARWMRLKGLQFLRCYYSTDTGPSSIPIQYPPNIWDVISETDIDYTAPAWLVKKMIIDDENRWSRNLTFEYNPGGWDITYDPLDYDLVDYSVIFVLAHTILLFSQWAIATDLFNKSVEEIYAEMTNNWGLTFMSEFSYLDEVPPGMLPSLPDGGAFYISTGSVEFKAPYPSEYTARVGLTLYLVKGQNGYYIGGDINHVVEGWTAGGWAPVTEHDLPIFFFSYPEDNPEEISVIWTYYPTPDVGEPYDHEGVQPILIPESQTEKGGFKVFHGSESIEIIDGSCTFSDFGRMRGTISVSEYIAPGEKIQIILQAPTEDIVRVTGIVTSFRENLAENTFLLELADPVTAGGGTVKYTSGNAIDALREAIENHGGTFETSITTSETVFYPDDPQDAYQFFRAVSYAVGGVLQYGRDGVYRLLASTTTRELTDTDIIADDDPTVEERTSEYANYVQATIDERWMTEATTPVTESYSVGSQGYSATRLGEQIQSETVSIGGGSLEITYNYDENGYMTRKEYSEEGSGLGAVKITSEITWSNISDDGNRYDVDELHEEFTYCQLYDNVAGSFYNSWVPTSKTTREWRVNLNGMAYMEEEIWGTEPLFAGNINVSTDLYPALGSLIRLHKYRGGAVISPVAGPLEGRGVFKKYNYVHNGFEDAGGGIPTGTVGYVYAGTETRTISPPALEMCVAEEENEIHIIAGAKDQGSIDVLGIHKYECQAVALATDTGMQNFALGVLYEKSRIRKANVSTAMGMSLALDKTMWRGREWLINSITVNFDGVNDDIELATQSTLNRLSDALPKNPKVWTEDVRNAINRRVTQFDNVSRGKVLGRVGKRRYNVQLEGKADPVEAKTLDDEPIVVGSTALLVRPTGKNQPWTLLSPSKEDNISIPAEMEQNYITPPSESEGVRDYVFYIGSTTWEEPEHSMIEIRQASFGVQNPSSTGFFRQIPLPETFQGRNVEFEVNVKGEMVFGYIIPSYSELPFRTRYDVNFSFGSLVLFADFVVDTYPQSGDILLTMSVPSGPALSLGWRTSSWFHYFEGVNEEYIAQESIVHEGNDYSITRYFDSTTKVMYSPSLQTYIVESDLLETNKYIYQFGDLRQTCRLGIDEYEDLDPRPGYLTPEYSIPEFSLVDSASLTLSAAGTYFESGGEIEWLPMKGHTLTGWAKATVKNLKVVGE